MDNNKEILQVLKDIKAGVIVLVIWVIILTISFMTACAVTL